MSETVVILVTGAGSSGAINVIQALRALPRYRVVAADSSAAPTGVFAAHRGVRLPAPGAADGAYGAAVAEAVRREGIRLVIPGNAADAQILLRFQDAIRDAGAMLLAGSPDFARVCANKWLVHTFLEQHSFPSLRTYLPHDRERAEAEIGYPMVIKPREDPGNHPAVRVATPKELDTYLEQHSAAGWGSVLQEYAGEDEGEYTASVLLARAGNRVLSTCIGRWHQTGSARCIEIDAFPAVRKQVEAQAQAARTRGPLTFQGRILDGRFHTFAINPRFANTTAAYALAGCNEVDIAVRNFLDGETPEVPAPAHTFAVSHPVYRLVDPVRYGQWSAGAVDGDA